MGSWPLNLDVIQEAAGDLSIWGNPLSTTGAPPLQRGMVREAQGPVLSREWPCWLESVGQLWKHSVKAHPGWHGPSCCAHQCLLPDSPQGVNGCSGHCLGTLGSGTPMIGHHKEQVSWQQGLRMQSSRAPHWRIVGQLYPGWWPASLPWVAHDCLQQIFRGWSLTRW